jgi:hypothetical protein
MAVLRNRLHEAKNDGKQASELPTLATLTMAVSEVQSFENQW